MIMKDHILAALREQCDRWEELLEGLSADQIAAPLLPSYWSVKDVIAHMGAWQKRSIARVEAALSGRDPEFPVWLPGVDLDSEDQTEQINAWNYEAHRARSWSVVHQEWRDGFLRFLGRSGEVTERDLLDSGRYPWLEGFPLAQVLLSLYDRHQEHCVKLIAWLQEHGMGEISGWFSGGRI